jgi:hypothetical protein
VSTTATDDDDGNRAPTALNDVDVAELAVGTGNTGRGSTEGGTGEPDPRDGAEVCPLDASGGGRIDDRGKRSVAAAAKFAAEDGTGVGFRIPGIGVGFRTKDEGCGVKRESTAGTSDDLRVNGPAEGGSGVVRFSGGGIVDLRADDGVTDDGCGVVEGGSGVIRFSDGIVDDRREDDGKGVERAAPASSSTASNDSPVLGCTAGIFVEERRDEPLAELCGGGASGGVFPIVTSFTLVDFSQRVIRCRQKTQTPLVPDSSRADMFRGANAPIPRFYKSISYSLIL